MTHRRFVSAVATASTLTLLACSGSNDSSLPTGNGATPSTTAGGAGPSGSGGQVNGQGGSAQQGSAATVGSSAANGGSSLTAGGAATTGGTPAGGAGGAATGGKATGGTSVAAGGNAIGGATAGGASSSVGGRVSTGGTTQTGGATSNGTCVPATCGTHKWACWKMPNPNGSGLPNPATYSVIGGVVHDNVTCLDWQQVESSSTYTNAAAIAYCEGLSLGGYDDWRAPTRVEMMSIMDWTRANSVDAAFTGVGGFHKTGSNWILTINQTGAGAGTDYAWAFNMGDGITSNAYSAATAARIRCTRGNGAGEGFGDKAVAPPNQYTVVSTDEVMDNYTGLIWQRSGNASGLITWDAAVTYCANLTLGGAKWRLPSVRELSTLVDEVLVAPSINRTMFPNTLYGARSNNWYWASHRQRGSTTASWALNFDDGFTGFNSGAAAWNTFGPSHAKCVR